MGAGQRFGAGWDKAMGNLKGATGEVVAPEESDASTEEIVEEAADQQKKEQE